MIMARINTSTSLNIQFSAVLQEILEIILWNQWVEILIEIKLSHYFLTLMVSSRKYNIAIICRRRKRLLKRIWTIVLKLPPIFPLLFVCLSHISTTSILNINLPNSILNLVLALSDLDLVSSSLPLLFSMSSIGSSLSYGSIQKQ